MLKGIVGLEIRVTRLEGKWKVNQNRLPQDRAGAIRGLRAMGDPASEIMADLIAVPTCRLRDHGVFRDAGAFLVTCVSP